MDSSTSRGLINQILYGIDRVPDLDDEAVVARCADSVISQRNFRHPPHEYAEAIDLAMRAGHLHPQTLTLSSRHTEDQMLRFLARLARHLPAEPTIERAE